jgi:hypothetical protein
MRQAFEVSMLALTIDEIQPHLMQHEQTLKMGAEKELQLDTEADESEAKVYATAMAFVARYERNFGKSKGSSNQLGTSLDSRGSRLETRDCEVCGRVGHVAANCRMRHAECYNCGEKGHMKTVCTKTPEKKKSMLAEVAFAA